MRILVTGGAGYIGSVTVELLVSEGHEVAILDDFSTGHPQAVNPAAQLYQGSLLDPVFLDTVFRQSFDAVVHFAGFSLVGESVAEPLKYYTNNVTGSLNLLRAVAAAGIRRFVFSSSAAVYGQPEIVPIGEDAPLRPVNPYGHSKLAVEWALRDLTSQSDVSAVALRYFNAAGASTDLGEDHRPETHLIPCILKALQKNQDDFRIYGDDYDTPDGTCIRDYIHVRDLARAHLLALEWAETPGFRAVNLGTGRGTTVLEAVRAVEAITGHTLQPEIAPRRDGDPTSLVAAADLAASLFGWRALHSGIEQIVSDAWRWHQKYPAGYDID
jgi:UDP-glucose 4-epimerase